MNNINERNTSNARRRRLYAGAGAAAAVVGAATLTLGLGLSGANASDTAQESNGAAGQSPVAAAAPAAKPAKKAATAPVTLPEGWTCEWYFADDKADCTADDGGGASLVIRKAKDHAEWISSPDKGNADGVYVTDVHKGIFISVQGGEGTTNAEIQELGKELTWVK